MSAALISWPAVTATPSRASVPWSGRTVTLTKARLLAGLSLGSLKPEWQGAVEGERAARGGTGLFEPNGASLTLVTLIVIVLAAADRLTPPSASPPLSRTRKSNVA